MRFWENGPPKQTQHRQGDLGGFSPPYMLRRKDPAEGILTPSNSVIVQADEVLKEQTLGIIDD